MENLNIYNPEGSDLRNMQLRMLEMLTVIESICKKHKIKYWLAYGTLLGAVRHGGFIPWDDDLDIELLYKDYHIFLEIIKKELPDNLVLQTNSTDPYFVAPYAKIRDKNSIVSEDYSRDINYNYRGIYIDIFPVERSCKSLIVFTGYLHWYLLYKISRVKKDRFGILKFYLKLVYSTLNILYRIFRLFYSGEKTGKYFATYGSSLFTFRNKTLLPPSKISFEGLFFNAPQDIDGYLKGIYGDYMTLPSKEKRKTHLVKVEFLDQ